MVSSAQVQAILHGTSVRWHLIGTDLPFDLRDKSKHSVGREEIHQGQDKRMKIECASLTI